MGLRIPTGNQPSDLPNLAAVELDRDDPLNQIDLGGGSQKGPDAPPVAQPVAPQAPAPVQQPQVEPEPPLAASPAPAQEDLSLDADDPLLQIGIEDLEGAGAFARGAASLARTTEEESDVLQAIFGGHGGGGRVNPKSGDVEFRTSKDEPWRRVEDSENSDVKEFLADAAEGFGSFAPGVAASALTELPLAIGASRGGIKPGGLLAKRVSKNGQLVNQATNKARFGAAATGGALETFLRKGALDAFSLFYPEFKPRESFNLGVDAATGAALNSVFLGLGGAAGAVGRKSLEGLQEFKKSRVIRAARIRKGFDDFVENSGTRLRNLEKFGERLGQPLEEIPGGAFDGGFLALRKQQLEQGITEVWGKFSSLRGRVKMDQTLQTMRERLGEFGFREAVPGSGILVRPKAQDLAKASPLGSDQAGVKALNKLADDFEFVTSRVTDEGGLTRKEFMDKLTSWENLSILETSEKTKGIRSMFGEIQAIAREDRNDAFKTVLKDTAEGSVWEQRFREYSNNIAPIKAFQGMYEKMTSTGGSPRLFAQAILKDPESVVKIKGLLKPEQWNEVKGSFLDNLVNQAITNDGIVVTSALGNFMKKNKEVMDSILSKKELSTLNKFLAAGSKLNVSDLSSDQSMQNILVDFARFYSLKLPEGKIRTVARMFKNNATAADFMLDEAFPKLAKEKTGKELAEFLTGVNLYRNILDSMKRVVGPKGVEIYKETPLTRQLLLQTFKRGEREEQGLIKKSSVDGFLTGTVDEIQKETEQFGDQDSLDKLIDSFDSEGE